MNSSFTNDWLSIYKFTRSTHSFEPYFIHLEAQLQQYVANLPDTNFLIKNDEGSYSLPSENGLACKSYKIFSSFMYQWASKNGFAFKSKLTQALMDNDFYNLLLSKSIFKDCADDVGAEHGAWSHALQWYCIIEHQKKTYFLAHQPLEIYQAFVTKVNIANYNLWHLLFDKYGENNFSSPEFTMKFLLDDENRKKWPLLAECIERRENKTHFKYGTSEAYIRHLEEKNAGKFDRGIMMSPLIP